MSKVICDNYVSSLNINNIVQCGDFAVALLLFDRTHRTPTMWRFLLLFSQIVLMVSASSETKEPTCKNLDGHNVCQYEGVLVEVTQQHFQDDLHISDMDLRAIQEDAFKNVTVIYLHLNKGNNISVLTRGSFRGLPNLKRLDLDHNVVTLSEYLFAELPKLRMLWLGFNGINSVPKNSFAGLSSLTWLILNDNKISTIEEEFVSNLNPKLIYLGLDGNKISHVAPGAFAELTELKHLYLNRNQLQSLPKDAFRGLNKLEILNLDNNPLTSLSQALSDLVGLKTLRLYYNKISNLEPGTFQDLSQLQSLLLYGNKLSHIKAGTFAGLSKLKELDLANNNIHTVDNDTFSDLVELRSLRLNSNNITEIDEEISGLPSEVTVILR